MIRFLMFFAAAAIAAAQSPSCTHTVGMVVSLTGAAGRYGQAASKSVELAFADLNKAAGTEGIAGCKLALDLRDDQSQGSVGVDQTRQLVDLKKVPVVIGSIISSVSIPMVTSVTAPAGVVQMSPASSTPSLTKLAVQGKTNGWFFRTITADSLQGTAAAKYALDQGMKTLAIIYVNNDFGVNMLSEFRRAYQAMGGKITSATPYNAEQSSYNAEVTRALQVDPPALYFIGYPGDGTTIVRTWIQQGGAQRFLLNDGMNTADFIKGVGRQFLNNAYGTSSGSTRTPSSDYFTRTYPAMSGGFDAGSPAADRAFDAGVIVGLAIAQAGKFQAAAIRDAIRKVTAPRRRSCLCRPTGFCPRPATDSRKEARALYWRHRARAVRQIRRHCRPVPHLEDSQRRSGHGGSNIRRRCRRHSGPATEMIKTTTRPDRTILAPGLEISRIVTGLWQVADMERAGNTLDPVKAAASLDEYARAGFDTFDMADHYGSAEVITGTLLASPHHPSVRAFTKWCPSPGPMTAAVVREGVERALHRLQTSRIDLMQFHWWTFDDPRYIDAMLELARLREQGLIAHLGLTNFDTAHLRLLLNEGIPSPPIRSACHCSTGAELSKCLPSAWSAASAC